jgi:hypothetical protein
MRLVGLVLLVALLAGCGAATTVPGSSGESPTLPEPPVSTEADVPDTKPPPVFLISVAGKQRALQGSFCVDYFNAATGQSAGACADSAGPLSPKQMTVVRPGDNVILAVPGATLKPDSVLTVRPLGCAEQEIRSIDLPATGELHWKVDLEPGAYQLDAFVRFASDNDVNGDVSGTLGLLVGGNAKENDYRGIVAVDRPYVCPPFQP